MRSGLYYANVWGFTASSGEIECTVPQLFGMRHVKVLPDITRGSDIPNIEPVFNGDVVKVFFIGDDDAMPRWIPRINTTPAGTISATVGSTADGGHFLIDGSTVVNCASLYPALWARLPGSWKSGTSMVMPDARGRLLIMDDAGATFTLGAITGSTSVTIASANLPVHTHTIDHDHGVVTSSGESVDHSHYVSGSTGGYSASHYHTVGSGAWSFLLWGGSGPYGLAGGGTNATTVGNTDYASNDHSHSFGVQSGGRSADHSHTVDLPNFSGSSGNGGFANTALTLPTPPSLVINWQIKAH